MAAISPIAALFGCRLPLKGSSVLLHMPKKRRVAIAGKSELGTGAGRGELYAGYTGRDNAFPDRD